MDIATANESTDIVGTARSVVMLLLDFLARLQRLPLTLQTPRLRILPTDTLNQVTLNQDLSVMFMRVASLENVGESGSLVPAYAMSSSFFKKYEKKIFEYFT